MMQGKDLPSWFHCVPV